MKLLIVPVTAFVLFVSSSAVASTLTYVNQSAKAERRLTLRRDGVQIVIADDRSRAVVASAPAAETQRVVVRGAAGNHNDTLTVDLSSPLSLPGGIDYDGGDAGWDTLAITGGVVAHETVTQRSPHDGVFDLDGLVINYVNLEPISDTVAAASLTIMGTPGADTVTIADGPGVGEATVSSPTFESVTFANKTTVTFDGNGGNDTFTFNNPTPAAGLTTFHLTNVSSVSQSAPVNYSQFSVSATGTINLPNLANNVNNIELQTQSGAITYFASAGFTIGGVDPSIPGVNVVTNGSISLQANGSVTLADTDGPEIVHAGSNAGDVAILALGGATDLAVTVNNKAMNAPVGAVVVFAGRDLLFGNAGANYDNDVSAGSGISVHAGRDLLITGATNVVANLGSTGGFLSAIAGRDFLLSDLTGPGATLGTSGTGTASVLVQTPGSVNISADSTSALFSNSGNITIQTGRLIIQPGSGVSAPVGLVQIASSTVPIDLGSTTDAAAALEISDAEVDSIATPQLIIDGLVGVNITVTQPITFGGALILRTAGNFSATGAGSLSAPMLTLHDFSSTPRTWTINPTSIAISPSAAIPYSGVNALFAVGGGVSDTFNVTPSATTTINVAGRNPTPPTLPGDALNVDTSATTSPFLTYTAGLSGYAGGYTFGNRAAVNFSEIESLNAATDLAITKTDNTTTATPGGTVTYTITVSNIGPLGIFFAHVDDTFPSTLDNISWTCTATPGSACNPGGSGGLNELLGLAAGGSATYIVTADVDPAATGTLSNIVTTSPPAGTTDTNATNDSATDVDALVASNADVSIAKTSAQTTYTPGGSISYTITVSNAGPATATNVTMTDVPPPSTTFSSIVAPGGFSCTTPAVGANGTVTCSAASLVSGANAVFTLVINVSGTPGTVSNTATATATTTDPTPANNTSTLAVPAAAAITTNVPTLSEELLLLLAAMLAVSAMAVLKRQ